MTAYEKIVYNQWVKDRSQIRSDIIREAIARKRSTPPSTEKGGDK